MASALTGLAQALLGGIESGAGAAAQLGFQKQAEERQAAAAETRRVQGVKDATALQEQKFAQQKELETLKIAEKGKVDKEIKQLDVASRFNISDRKNQTDLQIASQRNNIEQKKVALEGESNETKRKRLEFDITHGNQKLDQQIKHQTALDEMGQLRIQISQEQNEIARDKLKTEFTFKQSKFEQDKKIGDAKLQLDEKRFALEQAQSGPKKRKAIAELNKAENSIYQGQLTEYRKYVDAKSATDKTLAAIDSLIADPKGLKAAAGLESNIVTVGGTKAANFEAGLESLKGKIFATEIRAMVGLGSLSDAEGKKIAAAAEALSVNMTDDALLAGLQNLRENMSASLGRTEELRVEKPVKPTPVKYEKQSETPAETGPVVLTHAGFGDVTESDILETMAANNLTREEVLARLGGQ